MHNQDRPADAVPEDAATTSAPREGAVPTRPEEPHRPPPPSEARDTIDGMSIERWHERNVYHRQAMESRRSIQMKVFTGCLVLLLGLAKGGIDVLTGTGATEQIRWAFIFGSLAVPVFLFFFMLQIESVNKRNREWYHFYERRLDHHFANSECPVTENPHKEEWFKTLFRSWAATWPVLATLCLAVLVAYTFKNIEIKRSPTDSQSGGSVVEKSSQPETDSGLDPQTKRGSEK